MNPEECKRERKEFGLSQQVLADIIGYSQMAVSRYETRHEGGRNFIEKLEKFFSDSSPEEQFEKDDIKFDYPTKDEAGKFQIGDKVIKLEDEMSVGTLIGFKANYLLVSPEDLESDTQVYNPRYFKPKKSK